MDNGAAAVIRLDGAPKLAMLCKPDYGCNQCGARLAVYLSLAGESWEQHCHFHQHHGRWWRWSIYCFMLRIGSTTQMECQEPAAFRAEYWLPVRYRSFCLIGEATLAVLYFVGNQVFMSYLGDDGVGAFGIACYYIPFVFMVGNATAQSAQFIISYIISRTGYKKERVMAAERIALLTAVVVQVWLQRWHSLFILIWLAS